MGTWGEGNFDDDGALDYLAEVLRSLVQRIEDVFADEGRLMLDEEGEAILMPSVQIISTLCEHCGGVPPTEATVKKWRKKYLRIFDKQIDGLSPKGDFKVRRRAVIENTFARLEEQARRFWKQ
jgi:hypothetical protein